MGGEQGDTDTARLRLEESLALYRELGDKQGLKVALITLGEVAMMLEDTAWAMALIEEGLALSRQLEDTLMMGWAFNHLGHVAQIQGEYERARQLHKESLVLFDKIGARHEGTIWAHQSLGETALGQNDSTLATMHFTEALVSCRDLGDRTGTAWCLAGLAGVAAVNEEPERAARVCGEMVEGFVARAGERLGETAFAAKWAEGQKMTMEEAIAEALGGEAAREP